MEGESFLHVSLYRKYRPQRFSEIVGQQAVTGLLRSSLAEGRMSHAYLFSGPRGCGKTTAARIVAKVVNCENPSQGEPCCECASCLSVVSGKHLDVMEIDAASNRGIDQIRELKSHVALSPFMGGNKVYILDEVHMLTMEAFNALLKTLEEPPSSVFFLFATTEPHKVPVTIRSRCQHIPFHRISAEDIARQLAFVAERENFPAEPSALWEIARNADGAMRDALSLAEQAVALGEGKLSMQSVRDLFGGGSRSELEEFVMTLRTDSALAAKTLKGLLDHGISPERFLDALFPLLRDMWAYSLWGERAFPGLTLSEDEKEFLKDEVPNWDTPRLAGMTSRCAALFPRARWGLKTEVFSGLLLFELLETTNRFGEPESTVIKTPREKASLPPPSQSTSERPRGRTLEAKKADSAEDAPRTAETKTPESPDKDENTHLPGLFGTLWERDMSLCTALLDVKISLSDGALAFDFSEATPLAKSLVESPRARSIIAKTFGEPGTNRDAGEKEGTPGTSDAPRSDKAPTAKDMSPSELAAYLDADLLMEKPVSIPDELDEGFFGG